VLPDSVTHDSEERVFRVRVTAGSKRVDIASLLGTSKEKLARFSDRATPHAHVVHIPEGIVTAALAALQIKKSRSSKLSDEA
jgi:hypothetical protein